MASYEDDNDPNAGSQDEDENEDEEMEDVNEGDQDADQDMDHNADDDEDDGGDDDDDNEDDNEGDDDDDQNEPDSPSRRASQATHVQQSQSLDDKHNPEVVVKSPSPRGSAGRSPRADASSVHIPKVRPEALTAQAYDIVPTMAAPHGTSINAVCATPNMKYVFTGGTDGYIRKYDWVDTANGKVPLTVAQKHPFVDSVMKAGSMVTYWENEERLLQTPPRNTDEGKWTSPVYSLAVEKQAVWLLSGLESGGINLQLTRHSTGNIITTLKEHTSAVSVLALSDHERRVISGSWDKNIHEWDLDTGKVLRSFKGASSQISAIELRPFSDTPVPQVTEALPELGNGTFSSNNADKPTANGVSNGPSRRPSALTGDEDAAGSPDGSLFGDGDHGSLFGDDTGAGAGGGGGNAFGDDDDDLTRALESEMQTTEQDAAGEADVEMQGMGSGGPVQAVDAAGSADAIPELVEAASAPSPATVAAESSAEGPTQSEGERLSALVTNGLPHADEPLTAPATNDDSDTKSELPLQSESTFLDASFDGTLRIWDRRMDSPIATIPTDPATPPWCTGACWSPDGNFFFAGRRNCTVEEYSIHHLGSKRSKPNRTFRFQQGSGSVYAVRAMPNGKHLVCASQDILRIYDLQQPESSKHSRVPFTIVPGHRGGVISAIHIDPSCRFMLSAAGNRGWEGSGTEVLLGYEIGIQDEKGLWHAVKSSSA
ncbi:Putative WD40/YVTN repeat-like-containing domain superfamily [Septoria linicola]|uniref:WD40/YVTN repeat-like-containing domain superfamily n=1 Tax=Septoria linicola TaxID=215465 RepID=A0A9Q9ANF2_9PEZI|nr:putative WD40/YVTN repeat-like-containing domain superfamily [Septoria linicola]USW52175.1 Putative WD40/YVTN repeat-like-containing domain superfamily [Septoria linicola]